MLPSLARPLLHTAHLLTFTVLLLTGVLLFVPGLRAAVTGGYSLQIRQAHRWGGVAFVVLPALVIFACGVRNTFKAPAQWSVRALWQGLHTAVTILFGLIFTFTGFALWGQRSLSDSLVESSRWAHDWLTYAAALWLAAHVVEVGLASLVARISAAAAAGARQSET